MRNMNPEQKKFVHDLIAELLGLEKNRVIWEHPNAPRPEKNFATLRIQSRQPEAMGEERWLEEPGAIDVFTPNSCLLEIQLYVKDGIDAMSRLESMVHDLDLPTITDRCFANSIAFFDAGPVQDLTALLDGTHWETRALTELSVRYNLVRRDRPGYIDTIIVKTNRGDVVVKLTKEE